MPFGDWNGDGNVNYGERMLTNALIAEELEDSSPDGNGGGNNGGGCGCDLGGMGCVAAALFAFSAAVYAIVKYISIFIP